MRSEAAGLDGFGKSGGIAGPAGVCSVTLPALLPQDSWSLHWKGPLQHE